MLISIGIPTANKPLELESALSSVLSAEVPNGWEIEIIICINCDSLYLEEYEIFEKKYMKVPNLRISKNETKLNMTENWDKCINMMRGDYITILGDDDALLPYSFKCLEKKLENTERFQYAGEDHHFIIGKPRRIKGQSYS